MENIPTSIERVKFLQTDTLLADVVVALGMNILRICLLLLGMGWHLQAFADNYRKHWLVGLHGGQASDTSDSGWWQASVGHRWKQRTHELRINSGYLQLNDQRAGVADTWLRATWLVQRPWMSQWWDVQWRLKIPTADADKGLGTGSVDNEARVQALIYNKPILVWYYTGYRQRGSSSHYDLQDGLSWGAGMGWKRWSLAYDGRESAFKAQPSQHNINVIRQYRIGQTRVSPYLRWRTDGEWGAGLGLRW